MPVPRRIETEPEFSPRLINDVINGIPVVPCEASVEVEVDGQIEKITLESKGFEEFRSDRLPKLLRDGYPIKGARLKPYHDVNAVIHLIAHQRCGQATLTIAKLDESRFNRVGAVVLDWWNGLEEKYKQKQNDIPTNY